MHRNGVSNAIAVGLLIVGVLIGVTGYYVATTYQTKVVTRTETTTARLTTTTTARLTTTTTVTVPLTAKVVASGVSCNLASSSSLTPYCSVMLRNVRDGPTTVTGCSLSYGGSATFVLSPINATVPAGGSMRETCAWLVPVVGLSPGEQVSGSFNLNNSTTVTFSGTWS